MRYQWDFKALTQWVQFIEIWIRRQVNAFKSVFCHWHPICSTLSVSSRICISFDEIGCWCFFKWIHCGSVVFHFKTLTMSGRVQTVLTLFMEVLLSNLNPMTPGACFNIQGPFQYKDHLFWYGDSHYKDETVLWLSYLCNENRLVSQMRAPLAACREPAGKLWQLYKVLHVF